MGFRRISPSPQMAKKQRENIEGTNGQVGHVGSVVPGGDTGATERLDQWARSCGAGWTTSWVG